MRTNRPISQLRDRKRGADRKQDKNMNSKKTTLFRLVVAVFSVCKSYGRQKNHSEWQKKNPKFNMQTLATRPPPPPSLWLTRAERRDDCRSPQFARASGFLRLPACSFVVAHKEKMGARILRDCRRRRGSTFQLDSSPPPPPSPQRLPLQTAASARARAFADCANL